MKKKENMFCFQCEQTSGGKGCTGAAGVCGKTEETAMLQDQLTGALIGFARAADHNEYRMTDKMKKTVMTALFMTVTNVSFDSDEVKKMIRQVKKQKEELFFSCMECRKDQGADDYDMENLWRDSENSRCLKSLILFGIRGMAAYAYHAAALGYRDNDIEAFILKALRSIGSRKSNAKKLQDMVLETGRINLKCMALLDRANKETFGAPEAVEVSCKIEKGPFIVVSGHDLKDLKMILEQTENTGVNVYTHGEMLPAHGYPQLRRYKHLKGNFGTAWQNQKNEFADIPAPVLFTSNCLMPPSDSYKDRVFTTGPVAFAGTTHIGGELPDEGTKDFGTVIAKAFEAGGYSETKNFTGINGGSSVMTGFGWRSVQERADDIVAGVNTGAISGFYLVGGCDGARTGRNCYTEYVKNLPEDAVILTLACGKYRFNDLKLGEIELGDGRAPLPRLIDLGQCNDAYGAVRIVLALAEAFDCGINDLPLKIMLSWYEQKAVAVLLTLLSLGIKNIEIGPSEPAFFSPGITAMLRDRYDLEISEMCR